jgi:hypothetical protein
VEVCDRYGWGSGKFQAKHELVYRLLATFAKALLCCTLLLFS